MHLSVIPNHSSSLVGLDNAGLLRCNEQKHSGAGERGGGGHRSPAHVHPCGLSEIYYMKSAAEECKPNFVLDLDVLLTKVI